jgi:hypothetical protein
VQCYTRLSAIYEKKGDDLVAQRAEGEARTRALTAAAKYYTNCLELCDSFGSLVPGNGDNLFQTAACKAGYANASPSSDEKATMYFAEAGELLRSLLQQKALSPSKATAAQKMLASLAKGPGASTADSTATGSIDGDAKKKTKPKRKKVKVSL